VWRATSSEVRAVGRAWYKQAGATCRALATAHRVTRATAAGVLAALSPRLTWTTNLRAAGELLAGRTPSGVFRASLAKARAILAGGRPVAVLRGPKVRAFYRALMGDEGATVVDVWLARAAGANPPANSKAYAVLAEGVQLAATAVRVRPAHFQATVWVAIRGRSA